MLTGIGRAHATTVLTFEGLKDNEPILNFYDGGLGGNGSGPGPNDGITFSQNSLALIKNSDGGSGNFAGEPSPDTVAYFLSGGADTLNDPAGFDTGFSFFYSAIHNPGEVKVYDGLNATGSVLADLILPVTPSNPSGVFSPFFPIGVTFSGIAKSVDFGGTANQIAFDNITFGSSTPGTGSGPGVVPEPGSLALLMTGGLPLFGFLRRRR